MKHEQSLFRMLALLAACGMVAVGAGCGRKADDESQATGGRGRRSGDRVAIDTPEGQVTIDTSETVELPQGFPDDIPLPAGATVQMAMQMPDGFLLTLETKDPVRTVATAYRSALSEQGWTEDTVLDMGENLTAAFSKGDRGVQAVFGGDADGTRIQLMVAR